MGADLDMVSLMARLRVETGWERLIVPAFVYFFAQLYPFRWINRPRTRTAAAAGGCVLIRSGAAEAANVPEAIRQSVIDDVALARAVKRSGGRIWLGLAERVDSVRPYPDLAELWRMVARSAYAQLRHNPAVLAGTVLGLALIYLVPPLAAVGRRAGGRVAAVRARPGGVGGDGGHLSADAAVLRPTPLAGPAAAVHRGAVPADDGGLGGRALPRPGRRLEGPDLRQTGPVRVTAGPP